MLTIRNALRVRDLTHYPVPQSPRWTAENSRWSPVAHADLANAVIRGAQKRGFRLAADHWEVSNSGHGLVGTMQFVGPEGQWPAEVVPSIALRHSNEGRHAVTLAIGAQVFVCRNGLMIGEVVVKRRHTDGLDLDALVAEGLDRFASSGTRIRDFVKRLTDTEIPIGGNERLMCEAVRWGVLPWSGLKRVDQALGEPVCEAFAEPTAWALYNAFTEAIKPRSPSAQLTSLRALGGLFSASALDALIH